MLDAPLETLFIITHHPSLTCLIASSYFKFCCFLQETFPDFQPYFPDSNLPSFPLSLSTSVSVRYCSPFPPELSPILSWPLTHTHTHTHTDTVLCVTVCCATSCSGKFSLGRGCVLLSYHVSSISHSVQHPVGTQ